MEEQECLEKGNGQWTLLRVEPGGSASIIVVVGQRRMHDWLIRLRIIALI